MANTISCGISKLINTDTASDIFNKICLWNRSNQYIDLSIFILVITGGFFAKKYLTGISWQVKYKVLLMSTVLTLSWVYITGNFTKAALIKYGVSYALATTFYEIIIVGIISMLGKFGLSEIAEEIRNEDKGDNRKSN